MPDLNVNQSTHLIRASLSKELRWNLHWRFMITQWLLTSRGHRAEAAHVNLWKLDLLKSLRMWHLRIDRVSHAGMRLWIHTSLLCLRGMQNSIEQPSCESAHALACLKAGFALHILCLNSSICQKQTGQKIIEGTSSVTAHPPDLLPVLYKQHPLWIKWKSIRFLFQIFFLTMKRFKLVLCSKFFLIQKAHF